MAKVPKEIERRFLVRSLSPDMPKPEKKIHIEQGYIERASIGKSQRIRICNGRKAFMTMKAGKGAVRNEIEFRVPLVEARAILKTECEHILHKERWLIKGWEIDFYEKPFKGLILAEKEGKSVLKNLVLPHWLVNVTEVTDVLTNHHLARLASDIRGTDILAMPYVSNYIYNPVKRIAITGGPCSGKDEIMGEIKAGCPRIRCVPEMASIVMGQFDLKPGQDKISNKRFQRTIYRAQLIFEATSTQVAASEGQAAVLFNRGTVDSEGYMGGQAEFEKVLHTSKAAEYGQYDAVICLDVAPRRVFEKKKTNNPNRKETYEEACALGRLMQLAWSGHPNYVFIPNGRNWEDKRNRIMATINKMIF